jgi:hypothetical protein
MEDEGIKLRELPKDSYKKQSPKQYALSNSGQRRFAIG